MINHLAKPDIKGKNIGEWEKDVHAIALYPNVFCKLSGMVTEADRIHWKAEDFSSYMELVINAFGIDRILFGSDWPVCFLAASYDQTLEIVINYFTAFSDAEYLKFFGGNARLFYGL